jgi:hypothetical protein
MRRCAVQGGVMAGARGWRMNFAGFSGFLVYTRPRRVKHGESNFVTENSSTFACHCRQCRGPAASPTQVCLHSSLSRSHGCYTVCTVSLSNVVTCRISCRRRRVGTCVRLDAPTLRAPTSWRQSPCHLRQQPQTRSNRRRRPSVRRCWACTPKRREIQSNRR